jgi:hypothetical protein
VTAAHEIAQIKSGLLATLRSGKPRYRRRTIDGLLEISAFYQILLQWIPATPGATSKA